MTRYQSARLVGKEGHEAEEGLVLTEFTILRFLKALSEQTKRELLSQYLCTRSDKYLVLFPSGDLGLYKPDDVEVEWHDDEVA